MGYMEIGRQRYYDVRDVHDVWYPLKAIEGATLTSDSTKRMDRITLVTGDYDKA